MLFYIFYFCLVCDIVNLSSGSNGSNNLSLDEVVLHVSLEIEVGKLIILVKLEELGKAKIGDDLASVALVLKLIGLDVGVDLPTDISASHLGSDGLSEELGQLIADAGGLDETRRLAVSIDATLLGGGLLGVLHLARDDLLERLVVILESRKDSDKELELGAEVSHLDGEGSTDITSNGGGELIGDGGINRGRGGNNDWLDDLRGFLLGNGLLGTGCLGCGCLLGSINNGGGGINGCGNRGGSLRSSNHSV